MFSFFFLTVLIEQTVAYKIAPHADFLELPVASKGGPEGQAFSKKLP
jgi:hypothetical protein